MTSIFTNKSKLEKKDTLFQSLLVISLWAIIYLVGLILPTNIRSAENSLFFFLFGGFTLLFIWIKSIRETLVIKIEFEERTRVLKFVLQHRYKGQRDLTLKPDWKFELIAIPSRSCPTKKELIIQDGITLIKMSSQQNGLDSDILKDVFNKLKIHYPQLSN